MMMAERDYFYLPEICAKLGITPYDLQHLLVKGEVIASIWHSTYIKLQSQTPHPLVSSVYYSDDSGLRHYHGFFDLHPDIHHSLYAEGKADTKHVFQPFPDRRLEIPLCPAYQHIHINRNALVIRKQRIDAFLSQYSGDDSSVKKSGRPSLMSDILIEHQRRKQSGENHKTRGREAEALRIWHEANFKDVVVPSANAIRNTLIVHDKKQKSA